MLFSDYCCVTNHPKTEWLNDKNLLCLNILWVNWAWLGSSSARST